MATEERLVDVAINCYGKPYQTLATVWSLLVHSSCHLGTVFVIREARQPDVAERSVEEVLDEFGASLPGAHEIVVLRPPVAFWIEPVDLERARSDDAYRSGIRYQGALEATERRLLMVAHNDVLFERDLLGAMLERFDEGEYAGVGQVGQCWNCPPWIEGECDPAKGDPILLTPEAARRMYETSASRRPEAVDKLAEDDSPHPLPECRLNEIAALLDVAAYRRETIPGGDAVPFGAYNEGIDLGCRWYAQMVERGYRFAHLRIFDYLRHGWRTSRPGGGHGALSDPVGYALEEDAARMWCLEMRRRADAAL